MNFLAIAAACFVLGAGPTPPEIDDPFPLRDQLPFNLLFLDPAPRSARVLGRGATRVGVNVAYESTFLATDDLIGLFRGDDLGQYRGRVTLPILQAIAAGTSGQIAFVMDGEVMRGVIDLGVGLGRRFEIDLEIPFMLQTSGFLDGPIDSYHDRFGFPDGGRGAFARDRFILGYVGDGEQVFVDHPAGGIRPGDAVLTGRMALVHDQRRAPDVAAGLALKLPTGNASLLEGSGRADYALTLQVGRRIGRSALHGGYALTRVGDWSVAPRVPLTNARSLFGTYAFRISTGTALLVQYLRLSSPFHDRGGSDLGRVAQEVAIGFRTRLSRGLTLEAAFLENLDPRQNTPDVGGYFGLSFGGPAGPSEPRTAGYLTTIQ